MAGSITVATTVSCASEARMSELENRRKLWRASWMSRGQAPDGGASAYWLPMWDELDRHGRDEMRPPVDDYAFKRALGWQSEGADVPPYGDYAHPPTPYHEVPPFPDDVPRPSPSQPAPSTPGAGPADPVFDGDLERLLDACDRIIDGLETLAASNFELVKRFDDAKQNGVRVRLR